ncbi:MAG: glycerophosphodiester phosphodiesterase family protein [Methylocystis sp.]
MRNLNWLVARPIAHRGLHDEARGIVENSLGAARAAVAAGYGIECDAQRTADGEALVFHDDTLERLTTETGPVGAKTASELARLALRGSDEPPPLLSHLLETVAGRVPLVVELKSRFDGDLSLARRVAALVAGYDGPLVLESFDPDPIAFLRAEGAALGVDHIPLGMVAQARYDADEWPDLPDARRAELASWSHFSRTRPDFLSFNVADLPHAIPVLLREGLKLPVTVWTVRSAARARAAARWADQIVFEGFTP